MNVEEKQDVLRTEAFLYKGGKCESCGYDGVISAFAYVVNDGKDTPTPTYTEESPWGVVWAEVKKDLDISKLT